MKICFKCGNKKELTEFYRHSEMKDGYRHEKLHKIEGDNVK